MAADDAYTLDQARADLAAAIRDAGPDRTGTDADSFEGLVKPGDAGFSVEARLNGTTIPLGGKDVNQVSADTFEAFVRDHAAEVEGGDLDAEIGHAIAQPGPEKALVRVRAIDDAADATTQEDRIEDRLGDLA